MTVNRRWPSSVDESASVYSLDTESWQSVTHEHLYHDSPRPIFAEPRLTVGYQPIRYPDTSAGLSLDALAIADTLQMTNMYSLYQDQIYSRSVPALPQSTTNQISQSVHTYSNQSMPKAWSTTTDAPSDYQWIPDYDFQPDWSGSISQGQSERTIEDIKETGAVFHSRVWICRACGKEFPKKHALNKHTRCHIKHHVCPTPECDYQAYLKKDLRRHINTVHGAVKIPCPFKDCEYSRTGSKRGVSRKDALKRHMENHKIVQNTL